MLEGNLYYYIPLHNHIMIRGGGRGEFRSVQVTGGGDVQNLLEQDVDNTCIPYSTVYPDRPSYLSQF